MRAFAALYADLDATTSTAAKVTILADWLRTATPQDRLWTLALFTGRRPKRAVTTTRLQVLAAAVAGLPDWLFAESYAVAGDLAETIALVLPPPTRTDTRGLSDWVATLRALAPLPPAAQDDAIRAAWDCLAGTERFVFNKLLTGGFRVGVSRGLVVQALARATGRPVSDWAHRLMGNWHPDQTDWATLEQGDSAGDLSRPYPFALAHPLPDLPTLGDPVLWLAEPKWDGIRAQWVRRGGQTFLWSRGEELVTDRYPDLAPLGDWLPDGTVIDGELLVWQGDAPAPFARLQPRIGRLRPGRKLLADAPVTLMAYDLLEQAGQDLRHRPLDDRRAALSALLAPLPPLPLRLSAPLTGAPLPALRDRAVALGAEGLMLKRRDGAYPVGRKTGQWWKWKRDPFTCDAVMVYAQAGHGRRADLFTDYTFAVWDGPALVPVAKAYSGLTDAEMATISAWVRANTLQRFGPVRQVPPTLVFELAFEGIAASPRHKSGLALRFPRMLRWRQDKPAAEADSLSTLRALVP